jgi:hypothetical protein
MTARNVATWQLISIQAALARARIRASLLAPGALPPKKEPDPTKGEKCRFSGSLSLSLSYSHCSATSGAAVGARASFSLFSHESV